MLKLLFLGDIIGEPGRRAVIDSVPVWKKERGIDFVVVNGENSAGGRGITPKITIDLLRSGISVITTGDHIWDQKEIASYHRHRAAPASPDQLSSRKCPARAPSCWTRPKAKVGVINVQGRTFMQPIA